MKTKETDLYRLIDRSSFLKHIFLFRDLPQEHLLSIAEIVEEILVYKGETLFRQGDPGDFMYLIREGEISVQVNDREVAVLGAGNCLGDMALIDGLPRSASAVVRRDARLMRISSYDFENLLLLHPDISLALMRILSARIRT